MSPVSAVRGKDPIRPWFEAVDSMGDYTTFRFGHVQPGSSEVRWHEFPHTLYDGIGGFAHMLREAGLSSGPLQENRHASLATDGSQRTIAQARVQQQRRLERPGQTKADGFVEFRAYLREIAALQRAGVEVDAVVAVENDLLQEHVGHPRGQ